MGKQNLPLKGGNLCNRGMQFSRHGETGDLSRGSSCVFLCLVQTRGVTLLMTQFIESDDTLGYVFVSFLKNQ